jgi:hypothetical protein
MKSLRNCAALSASAHCVKAPLKERPAPVNARWHAAQTIGSGDGDGDRDRAEAAARRDSTEGRALPSETESPGAETPSKERASPEVSPARAGGAPSVATQSLLCSIHYPLSDLARCRRFVWRVQHPGVEFRVTSRRRAAETSSLKFEIFQVEAQGTAGGSLVGAAGAVTTPFDVCLRCLASMSAAEESDEAYASGVSSGIAAGELLAFADGSRLGALHGAALGSELGALEALTLALALLAGGGGVEDGGGAADAADGAAPVPQQRAAARVRRAAAQVRERVALLALASGGPVPPQEGVHDAVQQCRAAAKVCCVAAGFSAVAADFAFRSGGGGAAEGGGGGAPGAPVAAVAGFDF